MRKTVSLRQECALGNPPIPDPDKTGWTATSAAKELAVDLAMLGEVEDGGGPGFRTWTCPLPTVVLGRSGIAADQIEVEVCRQRGIAIVGRSSGGGAVLIGPGTLQWAFVLPHSISTQMETIFGAKRFCNRVLIESLLRALPQAFDRPSLGDEPGGDLVVGNHKVGGLALKRRRRASLVHGTILCNADLERIATCLRHPRREPDYRRHRPHAEFVANLGVPDRRLLERAVRSRLQSDCPNLAPG